MTIALAAHVSALKSLQVVGFHKAMSELALSVGRLFFLGLSPKSASKTVLKIKDSILHE